MRRSEYTTVAANLFSHSLSDFCANTGNIGSNSNSNRKCTRTIPFKQTNLNPTSRDGCVFTLVYSDVQPWRAYFWSRHFREAYRTFHARGPSMGLVADGSRQDSSCSSRVTELPWALLYLMPGVCYSPSNPVSVSVGRDMFRYVPHCYWVVFTVWSQIKC